MTTPISFRKLLSGIVTLAAVPFSRTARARLRHPRLYQLAGLRSPLTFHEYHSRIACSYFKNAPARMLVVGCNQGIECKAFVELNVAQVDGLDVVESTGAGFSHPRVSFLRTSAECIGIRDDTYDLVYSYATLEHVPDIDAAFSELARVTRPGGIIYTLAAPLWNSRYGHHKPDLFRKYPWIHLRMSEEEIISFCEREGITDPSGRDDIGRHVRYMMNPQFFNKTAASHYLAVCDSLENVQVLDNKLNLESSRVLDRSVYDDLSSKGYTRQELLALGHIFVGRKLSL